jgi:hypothetical protein
MIPLVSFVLDKLITAKIVRAVDIKLDSEPPMDVDYKKAEMDVFSFIQEYLLEHSLFIHQLVEFADMRTAFEFTGPSREDVNKIFGNTRELINFHIRLLSIMERNLFRPLPQQLWVPSCEYYKANVSIEEKFRYIEQLARITIEKYFSEEKLAVEGSEREFVEKYSRILSLPAWRLDSYTDFIKVFSTLNY